MSKERKFYVVFSTLLSLVAIAGLALGVYGYLTLSQKQSSYAESKYYTKKLAEKKEILGTLETRYAEVEKDLFLIDIALPSEKESSKILSDLNAIAHDSGLKLTSLAPGDNTSTSKDSKKKTITDLSLLQTVKGSTGYELPLSIAVSGPYSRFLTFIRKVENYQRLINIESIQIEKEENEDVADYIEAKLEVRAYIKK